MEFELLIGLLSQLKHRLTVLQYPRFPLLHKQEKWGADSAEIPGKSCLWQEETLACALARYTPTVAEILLDSKVHLSMPRSPQTADSYQQGCIRMTLESADLWKSFHSSGTEMIITKHGRRMFPHCSIRLSGLQPFANYVVMIDMVPADSFKYRWKKEQWEVAGKSEPQPPCRTYMHPDSPAPGSHWMKQPLSFLRMKLTNNTLDQHGHIIVHSMHRYYPRFHITQADSPYTVSFQQKLSCEKSPTGEGRSLHQSSRQAFLSVKAGKDEQPLKEHDLSACSSEQESVHTEPLEPQEYDYSCEEQMVPASVPYQPY
ncbi:hypothetical protein F7725_015346, partial [Dissostichus mawsoni]